MLCDWQSVSLWFRLLNRKWWQLLNHKECRRLTFTSLSHFTFSNSKCHSKLFWQTETPLVDLSWLIIRVLSAFEEISRTHFKSFYQAEISTLAESNDHNSILLCIRCSEVTQDLLSWHMSLIFILLSWVCVIQCTKTETAKCWAAVEA